MQGILDRSRCRQTALRATSVGRYYDPATAQFMSVDPLVKVTGAPYSFAGDNPLNGTDPTGLDCRNTDSCPPTTSYTQQNGYSPSPGHSDNAVSPQYNSASTISATNSSPATVANGTQDLAQQVSVAYSQTTYVQWRPDIFSELTTDFPSTPGGYTQCPSWLSVPAGYLGYGGVYTGLKDAANGNWSGFWKNLAVVTNDYSDWKWLAVAAGSAGKLVSRASLIVGGAATVVQGACNLASGAGLNP